MNKNTQTNIPKGNTSNVYCNVYTTIQLNCIVNGEELSWREVKNALSDENVEYNEIKIFGISNKLYKEIINYLNEKEIKYTIYGRSRIGLH